MSHHGAVPAARDAGAEHPGRDLIRVLIIISVALAAVSLGVPNVIIASVVSAPDSTVRQLLDVAGEANLPTWYAVSVLAVAASLHLLVAHLAYRAGLRVWRLWTVSAGVLAALSLDDAASLHERLDGLGRQLGAQEYAFAWVVPGSAVALAVVGTMTLLMIRVDRCVRRDLACGLGLFLGAAVGLEAVNGALLAEGTSRLYVGLTHIEELTEMIGAIVIFRAGLRALRVRPHPTGALTISYAADLASS